MSLLTETYDRLKAATCPEDVFVGVYNEMDLKYAYRRLAKIIHPDGKKGKASEQATEAFKLLNEHHADAKCKLANHTFGDKMAFGHTVTLKSKAREYSLFSRLPGGAICNVYAAKYDKAEDAVVKVVRSPGNNDLVENEATMLKWLCEEAPTKNVKAMCHIPTLLDSFLLASGPVRKRVNVLAFHSSYVSLAEIMAHWPDGIDIRDSAWMFNRLLGALVVTSQAGVVHGAVLPEHFIVEPEDHNGILLDWCYSVKAGEKVKATVKSRQEFYAPEILKGKEATPAADLYMAAKVMVAITSKESMPRNVSGLLKTCFLAPKGRPQDVFAFFKEFGEELKKAIGPRKYRKFVPPSKK